MTIPDYWEKDDDTETGQLLSSLGYCMRKLENKRQTER